MVVEVPIGDHREKRETQGMLRDHCKFKKAIRTRQACLTGGGARVALGHWVGDGLNLNAGLIPRARV